MSESILVVAAHPDDEVLGCGGTIAHHADAGDQVQVLIMAEGMTYLAVAYLGMLIAIGIWTWTVFTRSNDLEQRIHAVEQHVRYDKNEEE